MKKGSVAQVCIAVAVSFVLVISLSFNVFAAQSRPKTAVNAELEKDIGMPILDGDLWLKMTPDDKVAFIWGFWHVVAIENYLMDKYPQLKRDNFSMKVIEATSKPPVNTSKPPLDINEIVSMIDKFYKTNPKDIERPVVAVIWDELVKPNIKTVIAGRPLHP